MRPVISEFSYGYAVLDDLINWQGMQVSAAPNFPSLFAEGNRGYDVMLNRKGLILFLQFKVSDFIISNRAKEISRYMIYQWGTDFYRMHLRSNRLYNQHRLLINLENSGQEVYYVAPAFYQLADLDSFYLSHQVCDNSVFIRPSDIGQLNDNKEHHISYERHAHYGFLFSEDAQKIDIKDYSMFKTTVAEIYPSKKEILMRTLENLTTKMLDILSESYFMISGIQLSQLKKFSPEKIIPYIARTYFGCQLILIYEKESNA